ncbi:hypothetical protein FA15DRAFT_675000 [Coprinopsis marcescibilis]|uniref:Uncharacterized protein n=1 Tax=Coprinopsis marcescibilis TaxID=230819 RepID=A0A5C3KG06_COPMA|nr:hypothetical protein FA15DRAFT_675000 [Coprinopsis marcescibilis]
MLLLPPGDPSRQQPLYRISVELDLNPLLPISYVTKVARGGGSSNPARVAEFSLSLNSKRGMLTIDGISTRLSKVIHFVTGTQKVFDWTFESIRLRWDCTSRLEDGSPKCVCYIPRSTNMHHSRSDIHIATFITPPLDASPPLPPATLTVYPAGNGLLDHILVSGLVMLRLLVR